jgi:nitrogen fixation protein NifX
MTARTLRLIEPADPAPVAGKSIRIAIATQDLENLNAHFGSARRFALYDVSATDWRFVEAIGFEDVTQQKGRHDDTEDRITPKVEALKGSALLFVLAIGGPSAARVVAAGIHPIKLKAAEPIAAVITRVQTMLSGNPPPFLRKILGQGCAPRDMAFLEEELA